MNKSAIRYANDNASWPRRLIPLMMDPPEHTAQRNSMNRYESVWIGKKYIVTAFDDDGNLSSKTQIFQPKTFAVNKS